jgi:hypothetical protein
MYRSVISHLDFTNFRDIEGNEKEEEKRRREETDIP